MTTSNGLNKIDRRRIKALTRRREYLTDLAAKGQANAWDRGEAAALQWALECITDCRKAPDDQPDEEA